jgi:predicted cupin superfamily sugar epimerase
VLHPRAAELVHALALSPHPEGGHFREVYRSNSLVRPGDDRGSRAALTTIYFLLAAGEVSRWHRVASDEVWHYYEGDPLELLTADATFEQPARHVLGNTRPEIKNVHVVTAGEWQAARSTGAYTLMGCTVGPGFEFADFDMLRDLEDAANRVRGLHPQLAVFI